MNAIVLLLLVSGLVTLAGTTFYLLRQANLARGELARRFHNESRALEGRCQMIEQRLTLLAERQRIEHLFDLVDVGDAEGRWPPPVTKRLRRHVLALRTKSFSEHPEI